MLSGGEVAGVVVGSIALGVVAFVALSLIVFIIKRIMQNRKAPSGKLNGPKSAADITSTKKPEEMSSKARQAEIKKLEDEMKCGPMFTYDDHKKYFDGQKENVVEIWKELKSIDQILGFKFLSELVKDDLKAYVDSSDYTKDLDDKVKDVVVDVLVGACNNAKLLKDALAQSKPYNDDVDRLIVGISPTVLSCNVIKALKDKGMKLDDNLEGALKNCGFVVADILNDGINKAAQKDPKFGSSGDRSKDLRVNMMNYGTAYSDFNNKIVPLNDRLQALKADDQQQTSPSK